MLFTPSRSLSVQFESQLRQRKFSVCLAVLLSFPSFVRGWVTHADVVPHMLYLMPTRILKYQGTPFPKNRSAACTCVAGRSSGWRTTSCSAPKKTLCAHGDPLNVRSQAVGLLVTLCCAVPEHPEKFITSCQIVSLVSTSLHVLEGPTVEHDLHSGYIRLSGAVAKIHSTTRTHHTRDEMH